MINFKHSFYTVFHPNKGFDEMRYRNKISFTASIFDIFAFAMLLIISQRYVGPQFEIVDTSKTNIFLSFFLSFFCVFLFCISNWGFCVFLEGKAKLKEIWAFTAYSLVPYIMCGYIRVIFSNILVREESAFLSFMTIIGVIWSFYMLITAFMIFHEYEFSKAIVAFLLTIVGMVVCIALLFLLYSLFQQLFGTAATIYNEMIFRLRE